MAAATNPATDDPEVSFFSADEILDAPDATYRDVAVPEWGGKYVRLRSVSIEQVMSVRAAATPRGGGEPDPGRVAVALFVAACEEPRFEPAAVDRLLKKSAGPLMRLIKEANDLLGLGEDAQEGAERRFPGAPGEAVPVSPGS